MSSTPGTDDAYIEDQSEEEPHKVTNPTHMKMLKKQDGWYSVVYCFGPEQSRPYADHQKRQAAQMVLRISRAEGYDSGGDDHKS